MLPFSDAYLLMWSLAGSNTSKLTYYQPASPNLDRVGSARMRPCDTSWLRYSLPPVCSCRSTLRKSTRPALSEQSESKGHLNPVIAKLAAGKTVYGLINTGDLSLAHARETARAPVDFVYADMEHSPLDFPGLAIFLAGLTDKAAIVAKKSAQPNVTLFARFPPEADQSNWVVKQAPNAQCSHTCY